MSDEKKRLLGFVNTSTRLIKNRLLATLQISEDKAGELARDLVHDICVEFKGRYMYVASDYEYTLSRRDREIYDLYNGRNMHFLTEKFGITHIRVYQIVKAIHTEEIAKRQGTLPGVDID